MARARNIKPAIMDNEELAELAPLTRLLFVFLWMLADREGRLEDRPKRIAAQALAYDRDADVPAMLDDLEREGFIARYVSNGIACIQITGFGKHQTPHGTEKDSALPNPDGALTVHKRGKNGYSTGEVELVNSSLTVKKQNTNTLIPDSGYLIPDSLIPDLLIVDTAPAEPSAAASPQPTHKEGEVAPPAKKSQARKPVKTAIRENFCASERVLAWASGKGFDRIDEHLAAFRSKVAAHGYTYADWDAAFMEAIRTDWAKLRDVQVRTTGTSSEPGWRRDARERMQAAVPSIAEKTVSRPVHEFFEAEVKHVTPIRLG